MGSHLQDLAKQLHVKQTGRKLKQKLYDKIAVLQNNSNHPDIQDLAYLETMHRNIDDKNIYIMNIDKCFELGF